MDEDKENEPSTSGQEEGTTARPKPAELRLRATAGPSSNTEYTKPGVLMLSVGRTRASKIWIKDSAVSEKHAQLWWQGSNWVVQDTDSSNGTSVNGTALTANGEPTALKHGDLLKFGTDSLLEVEVNPVLDENVTVQQYLEAEARKQAQCIQAKCEQQASELQEVWRQHKAELLDMKANLQ